MSDNLLNDLEKFKSAYYTDNKKSVLFKANQKRELTEKVCAEFDLSMLFSKAAYIILNTNRVFIDYAVLKLFANPDNYLAFVTYCNKLFLQCIKAYGSYECHINLDSLTVTAVERHKKLIELFAMDPSERDGVEYTTYLRQAYLYNTPSLVDNITKIIGHFIDPLVMSRLTKYTKAETPTKLAELGFV
jgi:hypothetical protein